MAQGLTHSTAIPQRDVCYVDTSACAGVAPAQFWRRYLGACVSHSRRTGLARWVIEAGFWDALFRVHDAEVLAQAVLMIPVVRSSGSAQR